MKYAKTVSEKDLQRDIIEYLELKKAVVVKVNNGGIFNPTKQQFIPYGKKGVADILACYKGYFIAIEVKGGYNKPTAEQLDFLERVRSSGGFAIWTNNIQDVIDLVEAI